MISKAELKFIRSLKIKKYRTGTKRFLVEGEKNVLELLTSDFKIDKLFVSQEFATNHERYLAGKSYVTATAKEISSMSSLETNEQALAVVHQRELPVEGINPKKLTFVMDGLKDPGNLGTIIRTLDWFGVQQIICSEDTVDFYNPKTIQATMGSFTRVKIAYADLNRFLNNYTGEIIAAEMEGTPLQKMSKDFNGLVIMGSESHGIRPEIRPFVSASITIPRKGQAESLNVGIATGIICHHFTS